MGQEGSYKHEGLNKYIIILTNLFEVKFEKELFDLIVIEQCTSILLNRIMLLVTCRDLLMFLVGTIIEYCVRVSIDL